ncbi:MAG: hypothetical protein IT365_22445 [Candidatus Hydrogenedentes bacterium]|nr:hypothetical protein [Candidatus Hydrogenedentota bacterium]
MAKRTLTRRTFLGFAGALSMLPLLGCPLRPPGKGVVVFRRSGSGRHLSNAALKHAANHLYKTRLAAFLDRAHPGDKAKVVQVTISRDLYDQLFRFGRADADLRQLL